MTGGMWQSWMRCNWLQASRLFPGISRLSAVATHVITLHGRARQFALPRTESTAGAGSRAWRSLCPGLSDLRPSRRASSHKHPSHAYIGRFCLLRIPPILAHGGCVHVPHLARPFGREVGKSRDVITNMKNATRPPESKHSSCATWK